MAWFWAPLRLLSRQQEFFRLALELTFPKPLKKTNRVYLPRRKQWEPALAHPQQINLVRLKRLDGGTYADSKRPAAWVKPRIGFGRAGVGFAGALRIVTGASLASIKPSGFGKPGTSP